MPHWLFQVGNSIAKSTTRRTGWISSTSPLEYRMRNRLHCISRRTSSSNSSCFGRVWLSSSSPPSSSSSSSSSSSKPSTHANRLVHNVRIHNSNKRIQVDEDLLRKQVACIMNELRCSDWQVFIWLCNDSKIRALNDHYRDIHRVTDVLSFAATLQKPPASSLEKIQPPVPDGPEKHLGDLVIALPYVIREQCEPHNLLLSERLPVLVLHGVLHTLGYTHNETADSALMWEAETHVLDALTGHGLYHGKGEIQDSRSIPTLPQEVHNDFSVDGDYSSSDSSDEENDLDSDAYPRDGAPFRMVTMSGQELVEFLEQTDAQYDSDEDDDELEDKLWDLDDDDEDSDLERRYNQPQ